MKRGGVGGRWHRRSHKPREPHKHEVRTHSAPGKGATPLGKLCVSAVRIGCRVRSPLLRADGFPGAEGRATGQSGPLMAEELSWKAMMLLFAVPCVGKEGRGEGAP